MLTQLDLFELVQKGDVTALRMFMQGISDVDIIDENGVTALMMAAEKGMADAVEALIDADVNVNAVDENGDTALIWAVFAGQADSVKVLIEARSGADVNMVNKDGKSALVLARDPVIIDLLKSAGAK